MFNMKSYIAFLIKNYGEGNKVNIKYLLTADELNYISRYVGDGVSFEIRNLLKIKYGYNFKITKMKNSYYVSLYNNNVSKSFINLLKK